MLSKLKDIATTTAWITVGVTAITVEHVYKAGKHVHNEVKAGMPQDLVKYHINHIKDGFKSNPVITRVTKSNPKGLSKEALDKLEKIRNEIHNVQATS